jgi:hypothetical protein
MGDGRGFGTDTLTAYFPGATVQRNTFAGGSASRYPAGNEFPTVAYWQGQFQDVTTSNFALIDDSGYRTSGTDALDLGAPAAQVEADALMARQGRPGAAPPVAISSTTLPDGRTGAAYAAALAATGGSGTYLWTLSAGTLPGGLSLEGTTGVLRGTPLQPGTFAITVAARDAGNAANMATQTFALTIASTPPTISLASPVHGATIVGTGGAALIASTGDTDGTVTRVDFYANATILGSASAVPWAMAWDHVAPGTYRLTAMATDNDGLTTTSVAADVTVVEGGTADPAEPVTPPLATPPIVTPPVAPGTALPGTVQAEDFDDGGEGVGYHDTTGGNKGRVYRATDVDIEGTRDRARGHDVSWTTAGEWLNYTVTVAKAGTCVLTVRVASRGTGGTFHIEFAGVDKTGRLRIPNTGGRQTWVTLRKTVTLAAGRQVMRLVFDTNGRAGTAGSVNYIAVAPVPNDVVLYANDLTVRGAWTREADSTAAGGSKVVTPNLGVSRSRAFPSPSGYAEAAFNAPAGTTYAIWLRLRAAGNHKDNESVWVQFSDARAKGSRVYAIRSTSALLVNLEACDGCGVSEWGWQKGASWLRQATTVTFAAGGRHRIRVQAREDGAEIDQIVLSPSRYLTSPPGAVKDDATIVDKQ